MLVNFTISNFLSFKDEQTFSFVSPSNRSKRQIENTIFSFKKNNRLNRIVNSAAVYGANGSGKSNLIIGINSLKRILKESYEYKEESDLDYIVPFLFETDLSEIKFKLEFIDESETKYYIYQISFSSETNEIISESISVSEIRNRVIKDEELLFKRTHNSFIIYDSQLEKIVQEYRTQNFMYKSVVSLFIHSINNEYFKEEIDSEAFEIFIDTYYFIMNSITIVSNNNSEEEIAERLINDDDFKKELLLAFNELDFHIIDFDIKDVTDEVLSSFEQFIDSDSDVSIKMKKKLLQEFKKQKKYMIRPIYSCNGNSLKLNYNMESRGTKNFISNFIEIFDALKNGEVLIFDEIEDSYHLFIQKYIVNLFLSTETNNKKAQLLFTTHNTSLLSSIGFSKEQIWFIEKNRELLNSDLYSLVDFKDVSVDNHNWEKIYLEGRLGAIPEVFD